MLQALYLNSRPTASFSVAEMVGLSFDVSGVDPEGLDPKRLSSWWRLRHAWTRNPYGDGGLQSSLQKAAADTVGEMAAAASTLNIAGVEFNNVLQGLLKNAGLLQKLHQTQVPYLTTFVHGDLHGHNIMVDSNNNAFVIDFGKSSVGSPLEDLIYLETSFLMHHYEYDDEDFVQMVSLVHTLADNLLPAVLTPTAPPPALASPRIVAFWEVIRSMRLSLRKQIEKMNIASGNAGTVVNNMLAAMLLLRDSLMHLIWKSNKERPLARKLGLAFACGYASVVENLASLYFDDSTTGS